ncbi:RAD55 family ATPase, partial [Nanoarchaeota archaeon]
MAKKDSGPNSGNKDEGILGKVEKKAKSKPKKKPAAKPVKPIPDTNNKDDFKEIDEHKPLGHAEPEIKGNIKIKPSLHNLKIKRTPTGISGLDDVIEGGLKKDSVTLVGGCAGSGKSIFALQFLIHGIMKLGEPGIYVTFEEDKHQIYED